METEIIYPAPVLGEAFMVVALDVVVVLVTAWFMSTSGGRSLHDRALAAGARSSSGVKDGRETNRP